MRFRLHCVPDQNHVLAFCNANGKVFFWDLDRLKAYHDFTNPPVKFDTGGPTATVRPAWLQLSHPRRTGPSHNSKKLPGPVRDCNDLPATTPSGDEPPSNNTPSTLKPYTSETVLAWESRYNVDSPYKPLKAHKVEAFGMSSFVGRQVGWSPGGEWCVVVGSSNVALILQRWSKG